MLIYLFISLALFLIGLYFVVSYFKTKYKRSVKTSKNKKIKHFREKPVIPTDKFIQCSETKYRIFVSSTGSTFIIKRHRHIDKEYKMYLGSKRSKEICDSLGMDYINLRANNK